MDAPLFRKKVIEEICQEKGIEKIDISYDWISLLRKNGIERKLVNHNFYLNSKLSSGLAKDKYSTYAVLSYYDIPMIKHEVLFHEKLIPGSENINQNYECVKNAEKQIIKANDSSEGKDVFVANTQEEKLQIVNSLFEKQIPAIVVCPYQEIEYEYRAIFLYGEIIYIYKKQKPFVVGDGKLNVKELMARDLKYLLEPIKDLELEKIPAEGEKVIVGWKHNLSNGAIPILVDDTDLYYEKVKKIALQVGKIMQLSFSTIDIMVTEKKEVSVMEVNSEVVISKFCESIPNGYEIAKQIYGKVMDKMFEKGETL